MRCVKLPKPRLATQQANGGAAAAATRCHPLRCAARRRPKSQLYQRHLICLILTEGASVGRLLLAFCLRAQSDANTHTLRCRAVCCPSVTKPFPCFRLCLLICSGTIDTRELTAALSGLGFEAKNATVYQVRRMAGLSALALARRRASLPPAGFVCADLICLCPSPPLPRETADCKGGQGRQRPGGL